MEELWGRGPLPPSWLGIIIGLGIISVVFAIAFERYRRADARQRKQMRFHSGIVLVLAVFVGTTIHPALGFVTLALLDVC